jgi:hypothetical protein
MNMNRFTLLVISFFVASVSFAQSDVVSWTFESKKLADKKYEVKLIASVQSPWHIYSTTQAEGGPLPTKITFTKNPLAVTEGGIKEVGKMEKHYEEVFEIDTKFYNNRVEFVQVVNVKGSAKTNLTGKVEFMACTNEQCNPPKEVPFSIALK